MWNIIDPESHVSNVLSHMWKLKSQSESRIMIMNGWKWFWKGAAKLEERVVGYDKCICVYVWKYQSESHYCVQLIYTNKRAVSLQRWNWWILKEKKGDSKKIKNEMGTITIDTRDTQRIIRD